VNLGSSKHLATKLGGRRRWKQVERERLTICGLAAQEPILEVGPGTCKVAENNDIDCLLEMCESWSQQGSCCKVGRSQEVETQIEDFESFSLRVAFQVCTCMPAAAEIRTPPSCD
jgi:hypothetical protein